ncbi:MAG: hypothetical protein IKU66_04460, partial [Clostridia bacterium]|nr:hypothetical protein [Clostridia bacterium]
AISTAKEMASLCSSVEKEFMLNLDFVLQDSDERFDLFSCVKTIKRKNSEKYERAIQNYMIFFDKYPLDNLGHFYFPRYSDLLKVINLNYLESEYECILGFARDEFFLNLVNENIERIPVLLSPEIKTKTYGSDDADKAKEICELFKKKGGDVTEKEVLNILKKSESFAEKILGEFFDAPVPYIVLYYKAIDGKTHAEKIAQLSNVLAHEYMHYMEYRLCKSKGVKFYKNPKLSEAMADFFGVLYVIKRPEYCSVEKVEVAQKRYKTWVKRFDTCWPYAEALRFYTVYGKTMKFSDEYKDYCIHGSVDKFCRVFANSNLPKVAYNILLKQ